MVLIDFLFCTFIMFNIFYHFFLRYKLFSKYLPVNILSFGLHEDQVGVLLCRKLHGIGWRVTHESIVRNEVHKFIVHLASLL